MVPLPADPPFMPRILLPIGRRATRLRAGPATAAILLLVTMTGATDAAIGARFTLFAFYLLAVGYAAWRFGLRGGMAAAGATILASIAADLAHPPAAPVAVWSVTTHIVAAMLLATMAATLRYAFDRERWRASTDPLTGALNRAALLDRSAALLEGAARAGRTSLVACADLDGFKALNDRRGHAAGDALLRDFACGATETVAMAGLVGRIGGDEFAMLLVLPPRCDAEVAARRLHRELDAVLAAAGDGVGLSLGIVAVPPGHGDGPAALIEAADLLMYGVKRHGKAGLRTAAAGPPRTAMPLADAA